MITKAHIYGKYITMKVLYFIIFLLTIFNLTVGIYYGLNDSFLEEAPISRKVLQASMEVMFVFITALAYLYLFCYFIKLLQRF